MSLESVKEFFKNLDIENRIVTLSESTATVEEAANAHGVNPDQIAKTLSFKLDETPILIVVSGMSRIDNQKYRGKFEKKAKMLNRDEVLEHTGHAVGGVCPFGLLKPLDVYLDISLKKHNELIPAAGDLNSAISLSLDELENFSNCKEWIDVCK